MGVRNHKKKSTSDTSNNNYNSSNNIKDFDYNDNDDNSSSSSISSTQNHVDQMIMLPSTLQRGQGSSSSSNNNSFYNFDDNDYDNENSNSSSSSFSDNQSLFQKHMNEMIIPPPISQIEDRIRLKIGQILLTLNKGLAKLNSNLHSQSVDNLELAGKNFSYRLECFRDKMIVCSSVFGV